MRKHPENVTPFNERRWREIVERRQARGHRVTVTLGRLGGWRFFRAYAHPEHRLEQRDESREAQTRR